MRAHPQNHGSVLGFTFAWQFDSSTVAADPGGYSFRFNNAVLANVTHIYITDSDRLGNDNTAFLAQCAAGFVIVRDVYNESKYVIYEITGVVDNGAYIDFTVTHIYTGGSLAMTAGWNYSFTFNLTA